MYNLNQIKTQVVQAQAQYGKTKVAVYCASFDEIVNIFTAAASDSILSSVKWYGGDGISKNDKILQNSQAAAFAAKVNYQSPNISYDKSAQSI